MTSFNDEGLTLTIAVPFYRNAVLLRKALSSIFAQPSGDWTVLVVDNSVDESERIAAASVVQEYPAERIRYVENCIHITANENFNRCIELSETDLVSMVHGDDEVLPCYTEQLRSLASKYPLAAVLFVAVRIIDAESAPCFSFVDWFKRFLVPRGIGDLVLANERSLRSVVFGDWINGAAVCFRKSALGDLRWDPQFPMASDLDLWARVILSGRFLVGTRVPPAYCYRRHSAQSTNAQGANLSRFRDEAKVLDTIAERAAARGWQSVAKTAHLKVTLQLHILFLAFLDAVRGSMVQAAAKIRLITQIRDSASRSTGKGD